jgi:hypothetical protein
MDIQKEYAGLLEAFNSVYASREVEQLDEGMTMKDFKQQRSRQKEEPPIRKRGGISAPEDERSIGGEANRRNKDYWASVVGKNRDRGAGNKAKRRAAELNKEEVETDLFDYILEHLVAEGYADTNKAALAIMANMSEEWKQSIVEQSAIASRTAKVVDDQRQGYHGDADAINKLQNDLSKSMGRLKRGQGPVVTPGGLPGV